MTDPAAAEFARRLDALLVVDESGRTGAHLNDLTELARDQPEMTARAVQGFVTSGFPQLATILASAYQRAHDDDTLVLYVNQQVAEHGLEVREPELAWSDLPPDPDQGGLMLEVPPDDLARADPYLLVRLLSPESRPAEAVVELRRLRLVCALGLPLAHDPREVWFIPQARDFVLRLIEQLPHFAYFLHPDPQVGSLVAVIGCLADPAALSEETGIDLSHPSVVNAVVTLALAAAGFCATVGDDPREVIPAMLRPLPDEYAAWVLEAMGLGAHGPAE